MNGKSFEFIWYHSFQISMMMYHFRKIHVVNVTSPDNAVKL